MSKLHYQNNWEMDEYFVERARVKKLKSVIINDKVYKCVGKEISIPYNDMGHTYHGISTHYFITEEVFGIKKEFDLNELVGKVDVYAVDYTLEKNES